MARLFGTDGVRGLAGEELTEDLAYGLGYAAVVVLGRHGEGHPTFVVGRDPRASGEWLEDALVEGIRHAGGDALIAGVEPTPAIAFMTTTLGASSGVVISASHNPPEYNGIKFFDRTGTKLADAIEDEIEAVLAGPHDAADRPGQTLPIGDGRERYFAHLVDAAEAPLQGMSVVVDCANGAASELAPALLQRLGATVHAISSIALHLLQSNYDSWALSPETNELFKAHFYFNIVVKYRGNFKQVDRFGFEAAFCQCAS